MEINIGFTVYVLTQDETLQAVFYLGNIKGS